MVSSLDRGDMSGWQRHHRRVGDVVGLEPKRSDSGLIVGMASTSLSGRRRCRIGAERK